MFALSANDKATLSITDTAEWDRDICDESNPERVAGKYMSFVEMLLLFTKIRLALEDSQGDFSETLFTADGALALHERFCRFIPPIRDLIEHLSESSKELHLCSVEKSGVILRKVNSSTNSLDTANSRILYTILDREYIGKYIKTLRGRKNVYGERENYGEKVGISVGDKATILLNVPAKIAEVNSQIKRDDLFGFDRILATIPSLVTVRYENALIQTSMANAMTSIAVYPSKRVLAQFVSDIALGKFPDQII